MKAAKSWFGWIRRFGAMLLGGGLAGVMMPYPELPIRPRAEPRVAKAPAAVVESRTRPTPVPPQVRTRPSASTRPAASVRAPPSPPPACPPEMVLVEGNYCPRVKHTCLEWLDDESLPFARCKRYAPQAECLGERRRLRFCIDRFESADDDGLPVNYQSFHLSNQRCRAQGKRLCLESEWNFACEGEQMLPYPYGLTREPKCNQDREDLFEANPRRRILRDLRLPNDPDSRCRSPFGVINMVGNLDEPVRKDTGHQPRFNNALKGGWWMAGRNRCRPATTAHDDYYRDMQVGTRCCQDALGAKVLRADSDAAAP